METKIPLKMHVVRLVNDENQTVNATLYIYANGAHPQYTTHTLRYTHIIAARTKDCILIRLTYDCNANCETSF